MPSTAGGTTWTPWSYRPRTTPESSVNYAFFSLDAFACESWPLAQRDDILTELVLRQDFTVSWDIGDDT